MAAKTEKKDEKISLGNKIIDYWRTALTVAAFAIPVIGPVAGAVVGALAYGNYRKNNRTKDKESRRLGKLLSQAGTIAKRIGVIAIDFLFGGPIGGIIGTGLMVVDSISGGKLIQGAEKALDACYDILSVVGKGILDAERQAVGKMRGSEKKVEKEGKPTHSSNNPAYFPEVNGGREVDKVEQPVKDGKVEAELRRRELSKPKGGNRQINWHISQCLIAPRYMRIISTYTHPLSQQLRAGFLQACREASCFVNNSPKISIRRKFRRLQQSDILDSF